MKKKRKSRRKTQRKTPKISIDKKEVVGILQQIREYCSRFFQYLFSK